MKTVIGIPDVPPRPDDAHKGTFGTVIVVGGCQTMIGAPAICAAASLRSGVGLVTLAVPASVLHYSLVIEPGATGVAMAGDAEQMLAMLDLADPDERAVLAVGPGMGDDETMSRLVVQLLSGRRRIVLDADGLRVLARCRAVMPTDHPPLVLTPHPGEFVRLAANLEIAYSPTHPLQRGQAAAALAQVHGAIVVLKGHQTVVCDGSRLFVNQTGNPVLATAGCGDVLTGVIAGLCAQGMDLFDASVLGVHVHGLAADCWAKCHGRRGLKALELADELPEAFAQV